VGGEKYIQNCGGGNPKEGVEVRIILKCILKK
jgi:hypothetical protein